MVFLHSKKRLKRVKIPNLLINYAFKWKTHDTNAYFGEMLAWKKGFCFWILGTSSPILGTWKGVLWAGLTTNWANWAVLGTKVDWLTGHLKIIVACFCCQGNAEQRVFWVGDKFCVRLRFKTHFSQCPESRKLKLYENMEMAFNNSSAQKIEVDLWWKCDHEHDYHCGSGILHCPCQRKRLETKDEVCLLWLHPPTKQNSANIKWLLFAADDDENGSHTHYDTITMTSLHKAKIFYTM